MQVKGTGQVGKADGNLFIKYYGPQNPDGSVPTKVVVLISDKTNTKSYENMAEPAFRQKIDDIIDFTRIFGSAPTLDENGMLDPPTQTYVPDPEYDAIQ
jgi:hypothetical protein